MKDKKNRNSGAIIILFFLAPGHNSCKIRCYACLGQEILCLTFGIVFLMKMESRLNGKCLKLLYVSVINCWLKDSDGASHIPNLKCYTVVNGEPFAARLVIVWKGICTSLRPVQQRNRLCRRF